MPLQRDVRIVICFDIKIEIGKLKLLFMLLTGDGHMRLAIGIGKRLLICQWKHSAAWTTWCPNSDNDTIEGFTFLRV